MKHRALTPFVVAAGLLLPIAAALHAAPNPGATTPGSAPAPTHPPCAEVCATAVRALGECDLEGQSSVADRLVAIGEQARRAQLDCAAYCEHAQEAEIARADACFPKEKCDDYRECLSEVGGVAPVAPASVKRRATDGAEMVLVPAGPAVLGVPRVAKALRETTRATVAVPAFWIDRSEVTVAQYRKCQQARACRSPGVDGERLPPSATPEGEPLALEGCNWGAPRRDDHPINCVDYYAAKAYCAFAGARLASEVEWEKAARGTDARRYPWGIWDLSCERLVWDPSGSASSRGCSKRSTAEVGSRPAGDSPFGVHDMAGNVWEWVAGSYVEERHAEVRDDDASGPERAYGVIRGGGWGIDEGDALAHDSTSRMRWFKDNRIEGVGFRCAGGEP